MPSCSWLWWCFERWNTTAAKLNRIPKDSRESSIRKCYLCWSHKWIAIILCGMQYNSRYTYKQHTCMYIFDASHSKSKLRRTWRNRSEEECLGKKNHRNDIQPKSNKNVLNIFGFLRYIIRIPHIDRQVNVNTWARRIFVCTTKNDCEYAFATCLYAIRARFLFSRCSLLNVQNHQAHRSSALNT